MIIQLIFPRSESFFPESHSPLFNQEIFAAEIKREKMKQARKMFFFPDECFASLVYWSGIYYVASSKYHEITNSRTVCLSPRINKAECQ
jgi:hypothetical protein